MGLIITAIVIASALFQTTAAETAHVVGDNLGWVVPPGGPIVYATWAATQTFTVGDTLFFNFTTGQQDVARVTEEAFLSCNSTNPISLKTTGPAIFTLDTIGFYYFIGTLDQDCIKGQRLFINVTAYPGPSPAPAPRRPVNYTVGESIGWIIPLGGHVVYDAWAYGKTFFVGDTLVFNFLNGSDDVAVVTKEVYDSCNITSTFELYNNTPAYLTLKTMGQHFYTSTYTDHCRLGQKLAINVTGTSSTIASPPSTTAEPPSTAASPSSNSGEPAAPSPTNSAPSTTAGGCFITLLAIAMAFFP